MTKIITRLIGLYLNICSIIAPKYAAKIGFRVFCTPFNTKLKPSQEAFYQTSTKETLKGKNVPDIQVYKWGTGSKKILFVHGWQSHAFRWIKYILALKDLDYTVYAIDGPGHGNSKGKIMNVPLYEKVLMEFIENYGEMDFIVGHSIGAFATEYAHYLNPGLKTKKIVLLACPGNAQDFVDVYTGMLGLSKKTIRLIIEYFQTQFDEKPDYFSSELFGRGLQVEGLIVHDRKDKDAPFHYAETLHKVWTRSEAHFTKGLGHKLKSPQVVAMVVEYLER